MRGAYGVDDFICCTRPDRFVEMPQSPRLRGQPPRIQLPCLCSIEADAPGGTGFSFVDLAADRAGVRFARAATDSAISAQKLQKSLQSPLKENLFFPNVLDFPEWLSAHKFNLEYRDLKSAEYLAVVREIDRRIDLCPAYHSF